MIASAPAVSVVIPSYGAADCIMRAVDSALDQNSGNVTVIVVVDDGCLVTCRLLEQREDDRIKIIMNPTNVGAAVSRNRGLEQVISPYVLFLDADDYLIGNLIAPLLAEMRRAGADIGFGPSVNWSPRQGYYGHRAASYESHEHVFSEWFEKRNTVNTCSVLWSAEYLRQIGGWDERLRRNQDGELAMRAVLLGARFVTSTEGAGVWYNDRSAARITTRTDNLGSLLEVAAKLLSTPSEVISDDVRLETCARYYLIIAHLAFSAGEDRVGMAALERRRALGYPDYQGNWKYVVSAGLRVLPRRQRLLLWKLAKHLRGRVPA